MNTQKTSVRVLFALGLTATLCISQGTQAVDIKSSVQSNINNQIQSKSLNNLQASQLQMIMQNPELVDTMYTSMGNEEEPAADAAVQAAAEETQIDPAVLAQAQAQAQAQAEAEVAAQGAAAATAGAAAGAAPEAAAAVATGAATEVDAATQASIQAQAQAQAEAEVAAQQQAAAGAGAAAAAGAGAGVDAEALAAAQAEVAAQAQAEAEAQATANAAPRKTVKKEVANTPDVNQAAAVAMAASQLLPDEKPLAKMSAAEKTVHFAKLAQEKKEKAEKEARENPTVDENGEHITTVAEAKVQARQMQMELEAGEAAVEQKIQMEQERMANEPAQAAEPVKQEEDDGHIQTVEEAKAEMAAAQAKMDAGLQATDQRCDSLAQESANMPDFSALTNAFGSLHKMGQSAKSRGSQELATKLGVEAQPGDEKLSAAALSKTLIARASEAGKTEAEINEALAA